MTEYNGRSTFTDIEDTELRNRNQTVVLWNIYEENTQEGLTSAQGAAELVGYVNALPEHDRAAVVAMLRDILEGEGSA